MTLGGSWSKTSYSSGCSPRIPEGIVCVPSLEAWPCVPREESLFWTVRQCSKRGGSGGLPPPPPITAQDPGICAFQGDPGWAYHPYGVFTPEQDSNKTTTRQMLNLCIPMMPFTPGPTNLV